MKGATLCTKLGAFMLARLGRSSSLVVLVVSVKCGPFSVSSVSGEKKQKEGHCKSSAFFASQKAPTKNTHKKSLNFPECFFEKELKENRPKRM